MKNRYFTPIVLLFILINSIFQSNLNAQENPLIINSNINLPKDSIENQILLSSLNSFLIATRKQNNENQWILVSEKMETYILLDEFYEIEKSKEYDNTNFYKPYLTEIIPLKNKQFAIQLSYIGIDNEAPILRASFELIAHKIDDKYLFSSPLLKNTETWKTEKIDNNIYHYRTEINRSKIKEYHAKIAFYDKKLKPYKETANKSTEFFFCNTNEETLKLFGVNYKADYNGKLYRSWGSSIENRMLKVLNSNVVYNFDPHDLWHHRMSLVIPRKEVNHSVDEGISYIYGGSWGFSWEEIYAKFEKEFTGKKRDWLQLKKDKAHFKTDGHNNLTDFIINALLVKKIETEIGFNGVWELLNTKNEDKYFETLEKLIGINKKNYNKEVSKLIHGKTNS